MKIFILSILIALVGSPAMAYDTKINGYYRSSGTYVQSYHRTSPDNSIYNNYSYKGNVNPYTGSVGTMEKSYTPIESNNFSVPMPNGGIRTYNIYHPYEN